MHHFLVYAYRTSAIRLLFVPETQRACAHILVVNKNKTKRSQVLSCYSGLRMANNVDLM